MSNEYNIYDPQALKNVLMKKLKKARYHNNEVRGCCPVHDDRNPSFSFNIIKGCGSCFSCKEFFSTSRLLNVLNIDENTLIIDKTITTKDLIDEIPDEIDFSDEYEYEEAPKIVFTQTSILTQSILGALEIEENNKNAEIDYKNINLCYDPHIYVHDKRSYDYLRARGFTDVEELCENFNIVYDKDYMYNGINCPVFMFPCLINGKCKTIQRRLLEPIFNKRYINMEGVEKQKTIWGLDYIHKGNECVIVCEGVFDALTWLYLGYDAVAILGSQISDFHMEALKNKIKIINFDLDKAGKMCYNKVITKYGKDDIIFLGLEEIEHINDLGQTVLVKDANDYLKYGYSEKLETQLTDVVSEYYKI